MRNRPEERTERVSLSGKTLRLKGNPAKPYPRIEKKRKSFGNISHKTRGDRSNGPFSSESEKGMRERRRRQALQGCGQEEGGSSVQKTVDGSEGKLAN